VRDCVICSDAQCGKTTRRSCDGARAIVAEPFAGQRSCSVVIERGVRAARYRGKRAPAGGQTGIGERDDRLPGVWRQRTGVAWPGRLDPTPESAVNLHPLAWLAWGSAALGLTITTRNPYAQVLLLLIFVNVWLAYRRPGAGLFLQLGLMLAILPILFDLVFSRFGTHVMFSLPGLPVVGGPWTVEALVFGAITGAALLLTVAVFAVLQLTVRSAHVLELLPRPLYRTGTAVSLTLAFVPQAIGSVRVIAEARRLRGKKGGWRTAPGLLLPLLLTTLERALQYAESLDARGFGSRRRSRYRPVAWRAPDTLAMVAVGLALAGLVFASAPSYDPYLSLRPAFPSIPTIGSLLGLAVPAALAIVLPRHATDHA
jgi:energy-coupling factor transport system permease protein